MIRCILHLGLYTWEITPPPHRFFFLSVFWFWFYTFFTIFSKSNRLGVIRFWKFWKSIRLYFIRFSRIFAFFSKSIRFWFIRFYRISKKVFVLGVFDHFSKSILVWGLFVMIIFSKSIRLEFMRFGIFFKKYSFAIYSFYRFFQKCTRFGLFVFSNE